MADVKRRLTAAANLRNANHAQQAANDGDVNMDGGKSEMNGAQAAAAAAAAAVANGWTWACPNLEQLGLKGCHTHNDGVNKLVQMVEARNPAMLTGPGGSGAGAAGNAGLGMPERLQKLELYDCTSLGEDVMRWLEERIKEVVCSEPIYDR